jgi:hypothetical protein
VEAMFAMLAVLVFRAWLELKNYARGRSCGGERYTRRWEDCLRRKRMFLKVEGGDELFQMLQEIFKVDQK